MNQTCKVCGEPAAGFHFGAFTCEGCKSFFGRSYNNVASISECKNHNKCIIDKKNRTTCKSCRLRKCYKVGMSKGGSRYGRRSNWFKIHCLLQEQHQQAVEANSKSSHPSRSPVFGDMAAAVAAQQQFSNPHMAPGATHLAYPSYLTDIPPPPFMSLPFLSMMSGASQPSAFQMPPHLLFPAYHPAAAAAAAVDAAYHTDMFKHRQSVDSVASAESHTRFSPTNHSVHTLTAEQTHCVSQPTSNRESPELCVSGDDDEQERKSLYSQHSGSSIKYDMHSPVSIKASPELDGSMWRSPEPSFASKLECISPVSVCSIRNETSNSPIIHEEPAYENSPIDLSMKASKSSVQIYCDILSKMSEEEKQQHLRHKYCNSESSSDSQVANKRQKPDEGSSYKTFDTHSSQLGVLCV